MKTQPYNAFWQRIHKAAKKSGTPRRVMFELTYRCNFKCPHCYVPQSYKRYNELKTKEVFFILDQLRDIGCFYLGFTGGEPFMRKDIMEILLYAKRSGFEVIIYTNGSLINEEIAQGLKALRLNKVDITIPGITKTAFERISKVPGSRDKVFRAIDLLHKNGVKLGFKTCVLKDNFLEIKEIQDFARSLDTLHRLDDMLSPRLNGSKEPWKYRGALKTETSNSVVGYRLSKIAHCTPNTEHRKPKTEHRTPNTEPLFKCGVGLSQAAITPLGELKMCLMIDYPKFKILESSLKHTWQKLKKLVSTIKPDEYYQCDKCELEPYCKWCPGKAFLENGTWTSCVPETRRWAEMRKRQAETKTHSR